MSSKNENFIEDNQIVISENTISFKNLYNGGKIEKLFDMKLNDVHNQLSTLDYKKEYEATGKIKDQKMENYKMIPFAYMYYYLLANNLKIPTPRELTEQYLKHFCVKNKDDTYKFKEKYLLSEENITFEKNVLLARILRAYNSYNRELELLISLKEKFKNKAVIKYDSIADLCCGVDIIITTHNKNKPKEYGLATYVNTVRSNSFKVRKNTLRHDYSKLNMIDVIAYMSGENKNIEIYGDVFVYDKNTVDSLYNEILD